MHARKHSHYRRILHTLSRGLSDSTARRRCSPLLRCSPSPSPAAGIQQQWLWQTTTATALAPKNPPQREQYTSSRERILQCAAAAAARATPPDREKGLEARERRKIRKDQFKQKARNRQTRQKGRDPEKGEESSRPAKGKERSEGPTPTSQKERALALGLKLPKSPQKVN